MDRRQIATLLEYLPEGTLRTTVQAVCAGEEAALSQEVLLTAIGSPHDYRLVPYLLHFCSPKVADALLAFHKAANLGKLASVKALVAHKYYESIEDEHGIRPIDRAIAQGHHEVVRFLVSVGAEADRTLARAAAKGDLTMVKMLYPHDRHAYDAHAEDYPIYLAAQKGHLDVVRFLIRKGAYYQAERLFSHALDSQNEALVAYLVARKICARQGLVSDTPSALLERTSYLWLGGGGYLLFLYCFGRALVLPYLLLVTLVGIHFLYLLLKVPARGERPLTYLHTIARQGHTRMAKALLPYTHVNVQADTPEWHDVTALHMAILEGHLEMVQFLTHHGAQVNAPVRSPQGEVKTALDLADEQGAIYRFLLQHQAIHVPTTTP